MKHGTNSKKGAKLVNKKFSDQQPAKETKLFCLRADFVILCTKNVKDFIIKSMGKVHTVCYVVSKILHITYSYKSNK